MKKPALALTLLALLLTVNGCYVFAGNSWNTSGDVASLADKTERDWLLELREPYDYPQEPDVNYLDSDVELWNKTVLPTANAKTLRRYRSWSIETIAVLEAEERRLLYLGSQPRRVPLIRVRHRLAGERLRLRLVENRLPEAE